MEQGAGEGRSKRWSSVERTLRGSQRDSAAPDSVRRRRLSRGSGQTTRRRPAREIERHGHIVLPPPPHYSTQGVGGYGTRGARRPLPRQNGRRAQQWYVDRRRLYVDPSATTGYTLSDVIVAAFMGLVLAFALAIATGLGILFAAGIVIGAVLIATRHKLWTGSGSRLR